MHRCPGPRRERRAGRSHLPQALDRVLQRSVLAACGLADELSITPQAALGRLRQLIVAGAGPPLAPQRPVAAASG